MAADLVAAHLVAADLVAADLDGCSSGWLLIWMAAEVGGCSTCRQGTKWRLQYWRLATALGTNSCWVPRLVCLSLSELPLRAQLPLQNVLCCRCRMYSRMYS